jgi:hypothetical protein
MPKESLLINEYVTGLPNPLMMNGIKFNCVNYCLNHFYSIVIHEKKKNFAESHLLRNFITFLIIFQLNQRRRNELDIILI